MHALGGGEIRRRRDRKDKDGSGGCSNGDALGRANAKARARAVNGPSCTRCLAWWSGEKGEEEVNNDDNVQPYFGDAREGVVWAMPLQTQAG